MLTFNTIIISLFFFVFVFVSYDFVCAPHQNRSLSSNDLQNNLQHAMFSNLTSLTTLKLRSNSITELMTGVFRGLLKLTVL